MRTHIGSLLVTAVLAITSLAACAPTVEVPVGSETYRGRYPVFDWCIELSFANNQPTTLAFFECWTGTVVETFPPNPSIGSSITFGTMRFDNLRIDYGSGIRADVSFGQHRWEQFLGRKRTFSVPVSDGTYIGTWGDDCGELTFENGQPQSYWYGPCGQPDRRYDVYGDGKHVRIELATLENVRLVDGNIVGIWDRNQRRRKKTFFRQPD